MENQFTQTETAYTPVEQPSDPSKEARRHFSKVGFFYLIGALLIFLVQTIAVTITNQINPDLFSDMNFSLLLSTIPMYVIAMPLMIFFIQKFVPATSIERKKMTVGQWLIAFIICYAGMYLSNLVGLITTQLISLVKGSAVSNDILNIATSTNPWVNIFTMVLLAPVFEEILFRKLLIDRTVKYGEGIAVIFSGLMFGLFHGNLNQFAYAFVLGIFFGFIYVKTGNVKYTIYLHMIINFMGSVLGVLIIDFLDYDALMAASSDPEAMMPYVMAHLPQLMLYLLYMLLIFGLVIAGIILFIVKAKNYRFMPGTVTIPKGKRFSTTILNVGMILYLLYWVAMIIMQLLR